MQSSPSESKRVSLSVVIATLGGDSLLPTLLALNKSSIIPEEILVCIPQNESYKVENISLPNLRIIVTPMRGQVAQRAYGFSFTKGNFVLQMDDDLILDQNCIENLVKTIKKFGTMCAVGPAFIDLSTGFSIYRVKDKQSLLHRILNSFQYSRYNLMSGKITALGIPVGVDPDVDHGIKRFYDVDWIPGGCILHNASNIILENYFPFDGKAFCEDLIHSHLLKEKGVKLLIDAHALCYLSSNLPGEMAWREYIKCMLSDLRARKLFMRKSNRNVLLAYIFFVGSIISFYTK